FEPLIPMFGETSLGITPGVDCFERIKMKLAGSIGTTVVAATALVSLAGMNAAAHEHKQEFTMVRGAKLVASGCLPNATARVTIKPGGPVEVMDVKVDGLPANTEFDF